MGLSFGTAVRISYEVARPAPASGPSPGAPSLALVRSSYTSPVLPHTGTEQKMNVSIKKRKTRNAKASLAAVLPWSVLLQRQQRIEVASCSCLVLS